MSASNGKIQRMEYIKDIDDKYINIKIPHSLQNQVIIEKFLNDLEEVRFHQLSGDWFFDEKNCSIISPETTFFLTKKELVFIQLLHKDKVVTYEQMLSHIWEQKLDITHNALTSFVKNFKKKMPPLILKNVNGIGYRLEI